MNKLNLVIMALLCVILTSCSEQEFTGISHSAELTTRSIEQVVVTYTDASEQALTQVCARLELTYNSTAGVDMVFIMDDDSVIQDQGTDVQVELSSGSELNLSVDGNQPLSMTEVYADICAEELCYTNANVSVSGAGLSFIIEDSAEGF